MAMLELYNKCRNCEQTHSSSTVNLSYINHVRSQWRLHFSSPSGRANRTTSRGHAQFASGEDDQHVTNPRHPIRRYYAGGRV